jgi:hypothetical protein
MVLPAHTLEAFSIHPEDHLLSIRDICIVSVMAWKGPLVDKARTHPEIPDFTKPVTFIERGDLPITYPF